MSPETDQQELPPPPAGYAVTNDATATPQLPPPPAGYTVNDGLRPDVTSTFTPYYAEPRPPGAPVLSVAPAAQPQQGTPTEGPDLGRWGPVNQFGKQIESGFFSGLGGMEHLLGNVSGVVDAASNMPWLTGIPKLDIYKRIEEWARNQQQSSEKKAYELKGTEDNLPSKITRAVTSGVTQLPAVVAAATLGGPVAGFAALGALENVDQGFKATLLGATEGALAGKFYQIIGPAGRLIKIPLVGLANYFQLRAHGADPETAFANAVTPALMSGMEPGKLPLRDMPTYAKQSFSPRNLLTGPPVTGPSPATPPSAESAAESAAANEVIAQGQRHGVRLSAGDITQKPTLKNIEVSAEKVPGIGMEPFRAKQQVEAKAAAGGIKSQFEDALINAEPSALSDLQDAAEGGDQRARNVLEKMNTAGNDPDRVIQASIGLGDWTTRQTATDLYDKVQKLATDHDMGDVPLTATSKAIGSSLEQLRPAKLPNKEVIGLLGKIKESISPKLDEEGNPVVDAQGKPVTPNNSYGLIRQLHSDLGDRIREYYQGNNALIGEKGVGHLERVQNALEDDMRNYARNSNVPEIVDAGKAADEYYKSARVPYKNGMLAAAATSTEPDQVFQQFIKAGKGDRAKNFYDALDDRGRAAVRYNMVAKAVDDSINPQSGVFSPQKFFTAVDKLDDAYGVFFNGREKGEIQGFKNLMGHVTRAGQYAENPPTGQRVIPYLVGAGAVSGAAGAAAHPFLAGTGLAVIAAARGLLTTVKGRDLLLRLNGIKQDSPLMKSAWQQIAQEMPKGPEAPPAAGGAGAGQPVVLPPPPLAAPPAAPGGAPGGAPAAPAEAPGLGERIKGAVKKFWEEEEGTSKIPEWTGKTAEIKEMVKWAASKIGEGIVDPAALRKEIVDKFGAVPAQVVKQIAGQARDAELRNVRDWRLGTPLDDIHPLTSEKIPLNPEVEPSLSEKKTRLYSGHEQGGESRIWTPERAAAEGPLAKAKTPSQLSYIDVDPEEVQAHASGEQAGQKGRKLMVYTPGESPKRATGLLTEDVQHYLQDMVRSRLGEIPDDAPDNVKMRRLLRYGRGEFAEQLRQPYSGVDWYGPDTTEGDRLLRQVRPELADPDFDTIQKAMSAAMSNNSNPQAEAFNGARIWEQAFDKWKRNPKGTLQFPEFQPDGKTAWPAQGVGFQIAKLNQMIRELGIKGTAEFLRDPLVTGRDIKHFVPNAKEIRLDEHFPGSVVLGPKIGLYFNQIMNLPMSGSVVDVWMMRRLGRILGNLFDARGQEIDAPRTEGERNLSMDMDGRLGREHGLATRDAQSVGWHYEQELYRRLGLNVKSFRRSQGIQKYLDSPGLK